MSDNKEMHVLSIYVENHAGVLSRISGLFSRRMYNIDSLSVGETENPKISRTDNCHPCLMTKIHSVRYRTS